MARENSELRGPMVASAALHLAVLASALIAWPWARELPVGAAVPVNIVANAPSTNLAPAIEAPEPAPAQTEEPVPDAPATPAAPEPVPTPVPPTPKVAPAPAKPAPKAAPTPTPKPAPTTPAAKAPAKPAPKAERAGLDLDALAASVAKSAKASQRSSAAKGPARPETAQQARPDLGNGNAAAAMAGMTDDLQRLWNPNCEVEGGRDVRVRVIFTLNAGGQVSGQVDAGGLDRSANPVVKAAAERAIRAVYAAAPFRNLPRQFYGDRIAVNFNAREACS